MQEIEIRSANMTIRGLSFGDVSKPMILALHGWLDNAASFIPLSKYFSDYHLVALDLPGHGQSSNRSLDAHYHFVDFVQDLHRAVLQQGWKQFYLLGHSMGGIIASLYASCFPEFVTKYITIESFGPMTKDAQTSPEQLRDSIESRLTAERSETKQPENLEAVIRARVKAGDLSYEAAKLLVERNIEIKDEQLFWLTDRRLRTFSSLRMTDEQAKAFMTNIQSPVLAISGTNGFDMMKQRLQERAPWVTQLQTEECEGGHHLHMDNPEPVAKKIHHFLK